MVEPRRRRGDAGDPGGFARRRADVARAACGYLAVAVIAAGAWTALLGAGEPTSAATPSAPPGTVTQVDAGAALFNQSCAACHGPGGAGTANGPEIRDAGAALTDLMLRSGRMPLAAPGLPDRRGDPAFDEDQITALVAYVASLGAGPPIPGQVTGGDVGSGRALFNANCAACHGPAGGGGAVGGGFVAPPLAPPTDQEVAEAIVGGPGPMPRFGFDEQRLRDLVAYVHFLRNPPSPGGASAPAVGPVTEGFIAGLVLLALLLVARWIAVRQHEPRP